MHIGLPKTATTTLQSELFSKINSRELKYFGVRQPRSEKQTELYQAFLNGVNDARNGGIFKQNVKEILSTGQSILLSDEMVTVSGKGADWEQKIHNLAEITKELEYSLLITVREPVDAMFSFYVELYSRFRKRGRGFIDTALYDNDMAIYHYQSFFELLYTLFGAQHLFVTDFRSIISGEKKWVHDFFSPFMSEIPDVDPEKKYNTKSRDVNKTYTGKKYSPAMRISNSIKKNILYKQLETIGVVKILKPLVKNLKAVKVKESVQSPSETEIGYLRMRLKNSYEFLEDELQIRY